jgi:nucleoside-diphosphate-sugar epimerase
MTFREANLLKPETLEPCVEDVEAVIHLAAYFDFYPSDEELMFRINVDGTRNLMDACVGSPVSRFIYCSSTEAIGPVEFPPGNEDTVTNPTFAYGESKVQAEKAVRKIGKQHDLDYIILRPTGVMGEGDLYTGYELIKALNNKEVPVLPGDGEKHIMYTHVDDVVRGFAKSLASQSALNETIILCPDEPEKYKSLVEYIADVLGVEPPTRYIPTSVAKMGIGLLSPFKNRGKTTFLWHMQSIQSMDEERWYSNEKAKRLLGWSPIITMREGIKRAIDWYYENDYLERK